MNNYYVYILTNSTNNVLYIGVTNNIERRIYEHKNKLMDGFPARYNLNKVVYIEHSSSIEDAIAREKQLKKWNRINKIRLIESINPKWQDLSNENFKVE